MSHFLHLSYCYMCAGVGRCVWRVYLLSSPGQPPQLLLCPAGLTRSHLNTCSLWTKHGQMLVCGLTPLWVGPMINEKNGWKNAFFKKQFFKKDRWIFNVFCMRKKLGKCSRGRGDSGKKRAEKPQIFKKKKKKKKFKKKNLKIWESLGSESQACGGWLCNKWKMRVPGWQQLVHMSQKQSFMHMLSLSGHHALESYGRPAVMCWKIKCLRPAQNYTVGENDWQFEACVGFPEGFSKRKKNPKL